MEDFVTALYLSRDKVNRSKWTTDIHSSIKPKVNFLFLINKCPRNQKVVCSVWTTNRKSLPLGGAPSTCTKGKVGQRQQQAAERARLCSHGRLSREIRCWVLGEYLQELWSSLARLCLFPRPWQLQRSGSRSKVAEKSFSPSREKGIIRLKNLTD